jgi:hypothetical protein
MKGHHLDIATASFCLRGFHIGAGFLGLVAFWLAIALRKGSRGHIVCGWVFVACTCVLLGTALTICVWRLIEPLRSLSYRFEPAPDQVEETVRTLHLIYAFLGALAVYTLVPLVLAVRVIRTRRNPERLAGPLSGLLLFLEVIVSLTLIAYSLTLWIDNPAMILYGVPMGCGFGGLASAWWDWRFIARPRTSTMDWLYKHMEFMLRTGIAYHTAFAVFVLTPWLGSLGSGSLALVPWVLPSVIGLPLTWKWIRNYRRKFALPVSGNALFTKNRGLDTILNDD